MFRAAIMRSWQVGVFVLFVGDPQRPQGVPTCCSRVMAEVSEAALARWLTVALLKV